MRHHHWLLAAVVLLGLWTWSKRVDNPDTTPPAPASQPATQPAPQAPGPVGTPSGPADTAPQPAAATGRTGTAAYPAFIPPEAHPVLEAIARGGPYHYRQDGNVFQNRERRLPAQPRGYYHEFTVDTPGSDDRGARRIVTGGNPPVEYWYTDDHYRTFRRFEPNGAAR
ncbi:ribonuclease domain-containing protein [Aerolutibacter ruishenii]|uniref:Guanyl-specific ribonuclease Sa n=1 Tax=Aerolutibacter ruishenii TaxID=686800 RepID=A0A562M0S0_9GAMM|nr:ribonuclease domain-containing protein [Lysobacter ruishenii]TWI13480.1 guanyl-specific ribonuclease Sa [Lysobacter ruishenii]